MEETTKVEDTMSNININNDLLEIKSIVEKYGLQVNSNLPMQMEEVNNELIKDFIVHFYIKDEVLPEDVSNIIKYNSTFSRYLNQFIKKRMQIIFTDDSTDVYQEIFIIINLLSLGENYYIFEQYNLYSIPNLEKLFATYEKKLTLLDPHEDNEEFEITFSNYVHLIEVFNSQCVINSIDVKRRKSISALMECLTSTMSSVKFQVKLDENKLTILNQILGKLLLYFSYVPYIDATNKSVDDLIKEYIFVLDKILDGYDLLKDISSQEEGLSEYYFVYLEKVTTLILTLILKLDARISYSTGVFDFNSSFLNLINYYNDCVQESFDEDELSLGKFKEHLLNNYLRVYNNTIDSKIEADYLFIIDEFVKNAEFNNSNMILLHNIILYDRNLSKEIIEAILLKFLNMPKLTNDYHEFFKLKIIDIIINRFDDFNMPVEENNFLEKIATYNEKNKTASHLISMYSKIYLSLARYCSPSKQEKYNTLSKEYFSLYSSIDNFDLLNQEYKAINDIVIKNYGLYYAQDFKDKENISDDNLMIIGRKNIDAYIRDRDAKIKLEINNELMGLYQGVLNNEIKSLADISEKLNVVISKNIFSGLVTLEVLKSNQVNYDDLEVGYKKSVIELNDKYSMVYVYSKAYSNLFEFIYDRNKLYIDTNILNVINSFLNSIPSFSDPVTGLANLSQLKVDLKKQKNEIVFIEVYIDSVVDISKRYVYKQSNEYFKLIAQQFQTFGKCYRLTGPRIAFYLSSTGNYEEIVASIKGLEIPFEDEPTQVRTTIGVSFGNADTILDKSHYALSAAYLKQERYYEYR